MHRCARTTARTRFNFLCILAVGLKQSGFAIEVRAVQSVQLRRSVLPSTHGSRDDSKPSSADPEKHSFSRQAGDPPRETDLRSQSGDWLFHVQTTVCRGDSFDNTTNSLFSRIVLPLLFVLSTCAISATAIGNRKAGVETETLKPWQTFRDSDIPGLPSGYSQKTASAMMPEVPESKSRLWHLDFARVCAVICVVFEHSGGEDYARRNVGFCLWWVLPYLYMTSGMGFMMSKSSICRYVARLLCILVVGVGANLIADLVNHRDWQHDFGNTVFQMFFVVMLIAMAVIMEPLRRLLRYRQIDPNSQVTLGGVLGAVLWCSIVLVALWCFVTGRSLDIAARDGAGKGWLQYYAPIFEHAHVIVVQVGGVIFLCTLAAMIAKPDHAGLVGWLLLPFVYLPRVVLPFNQDGFPHLICLYILAMATTVWPLRGSATIGKWARSYWPFLVLLLMLISMIDMWGRCDMQPPYAMWERFRMCIGELILVICFLTGAFAPDDPYEITIWMGYWALYAYCFHVMWFRLLGTPYGAVVTLSSAIIFGALHAGFEASRKKADALKQGMSVEGA